MELCGIGRGPWDKECLVGTIYWIKNFQGTQRTVGREGSNPVYKKQPGGLVYCIIYFDICDLRKLFIRVKLVVTSVNYCKQYTMWIYNLVSFYFLIVCIFWLAKHSEILTLKSYSKTDLIYYYFNFNLS